MNVGVKFKDKFGKIRTHLTSMDNQPLGKAAIVIIIFLDIFILVSIFNGLVSKDKENHRKESNLQMTKAELAGKLNKSIGITQKEAIEDVGIILGLIKDTLESGEQVKISGFGIFEVKQKNARQGRNPQTGEKMTLAARRVITFKPSSVLRDAINKAEQ